MCASLKDGESEVSEAGVGWLKALEGLISPDVCLSHDNDVVSFTEGIGIESDWFHDDFRVVS